jgi:hypothetical protein
VPVSPACLREMVRPRRQRKHRPYWRLRRAIHPSRGLQKEAIQKLCPFTQALSRRQSLEKPFESCRRKNLLRRQRPFFESLRRHSSKSSESPGSEPHLNPIHWTRFLFEVDRTFPNPCHICGWKSLAVYPNQTLNIDDESCGYPPSVNIEVTLEEVISGCRESFRHWKMC